jgi:HK97 family phage portal protein
VRAPQVATLSEQGVLGLSQGMGGMTGQWTDEQAWRLAYYANVWVYRCVQCVAEDLASIPLRVGPDPAQPDSYDTGHPLAVLLGPPPGSPNPETSPRRLLMWTVAQWLVQGRFAWEVEPGPSGQPMYLWPIPASRVTPVPSKAGDRYWDGYLYDQGQGRTKRLSRDRVLYEWKPSATDWRTPESVMAAARLDLSVAVMQDRYDYAFLRNDARPAAVVVHESFASVDDRDAWRQQFVGAHAGPDNAGKLHFTETSEGGAAPKDALLIQTLGLSQKDAEFVARYEAKLRAIEVAFGVPRSRLHDASGRTYANADAEWAGYWRTTVRNLAIDLADAINVRLAPRFGMDVAWFDFSTHPALRDEPPFPVEQAVPLVRAGLATKNEVRTKVLHLPAVEGGDELVAAPTMADLLAAQQGMLPADVADPTKAPAGGAAPASADDVADAQPDSAAADNERTFQVDAQVVRVHRVSRVELAGLMDAERDVRARALERAVDATATRLEQSWERKLARLFDRQMESVLDRLEGKRGRQALRNALEPDADAIFNQVFWRSETEQLALDLYGDAVGAAFQAHQALIGISFNLDNVWARDFIMQRSNQLAGRVTDTTYRGIKAALADGAAEGEAIPKLADRIRHLFQQTYKNRATVVARTEVISAYNGGSELALRNSPRDVAAGKEWIAALDDRTRDAHALADGQIVEPEAAFIVMGESLQYPGDPGGSSANVVQCRCTVAPVAPEDMPERRSVALPERVPVERVERALAAVAAGASLGAAVRHLADA